MALTIDGTTSKVVESQSSDPTASTNPAGGAGTVILNTTTGKIFTCTDASNNANVWTTVGPTLDEITKQGSDPTISTNPAGGVGSIILNTTSGKMFVCSTATGGANVWKAGEEGSIGPFIQATGGTITTDGNYRIHTFTTSSTDFVVSDAGQSPYNVVDYLIIAGGGGGGDSLGAGGGAGGLRNSFNSETSGGGGSSESELTVTATSYTVTIGAGGPSITNGIPTSISGAGITTISTVGGGYGGTINTPKAGQTGGSGGGAYTNNTAGARTPNQGYIGGTGAVESPGDFTSGGGGAGGAGTAFQASVRGGHGGVGLQSNIDGNNFYWAGGGGGSGYASAVRPAGNGGIGGGGGGGHDSGLTPGTGGGSAKNSGSAGTAAGSGSNPGGNAGINTGSGGGGGGYNNAGGGSGGSGILIVRYRFQ